MSAPEGRAQGDTPGAFVLLGDDTAPGCVGDACALPGHGTPSGTTSEAGREDHARRP